MRLHACSHLSINHIYDLVKLRALLIWVVALLRSLGHQAAVGCVKWLHCKRLTNSHFRKCRMKPLLFQVMIICPDPNRMEAYLGFVPDLWRPAQCWRCHQRCCWHVHFILLWKSIIWKNKEVHCQRQANLEPRMVEYALNGEPALRLRLQKLTHHVLGWR